MLQSGHFSRPAGVLIFFSKYLVPKQSLTLSPSGTRLCCPCLLPTSLPLLKATLERLWETERAGSNVPCKRYLFCV